MLSPQFHDSFGPEPVRLNERVSYNRYKGHQLKYFRMEKPELPEFEIGQLPKAGTKLYRGVRSPSMTTHSDEEVKSLGLGEVRDVQEEGVVGISWSESPSWGASFTEHGGFILETEVDDPEGQIMPRRAIRHSNANDARVADEQARDEREYNPRPGARLRVTNREELLGLGFNVPESLKVEHRGTLRYSNLEDFRVKDED